MFKGLQVSRDGGKTWRRGGPLPEDTFDLAAPADNPDRLFAAARGGLFVSDDGGTEWTTIQAQPTTMVHVTEAGRIYAFIFGLGLVTSSHARTGWEKLSGRFGDRYLLHMTVDPTNPEILHAVADTSAILTSRDGGRTWVSYQDHVRATPDLVAVGGRLFDQLCQSCHGAKGVGERPEDMHTTDEYGFVAPPLDNSSHGWHHSDDGLVRTILNGSSRNPRMMPFKELITETDARNLVAYVKSLWNFSSLACQGARHMRCMH
jgi:mono/diheme cytochrome c family protein